MASEKIDIKFNVPAVTGREMGYIARVFEEGKFSGNHEYSKSCDALLKGMLGSHAAMVTPSCTHALEMSAILADVKEGDEIIMSPFVFTSTANAFVMRGARIVFIDVRPDTMNMDETLIEPALTDRTKAIVAMHYGGVSCEMDKVMQVAEEYSLFVVEDAAQAILSTYNGRFCGTFGQFGCISFHETKNIQCGEGGALLINEPRYIERAEFLREKGTDRSRFFRGEVDKYTWVDVGSSQLLSEINSAFLLAQLEMAGDIIEQRVRAWYLYYKTLLPLRDAGLVELPVVPDGCVHNGHIFYIKTKDADERQRLIAHMKQRGISCVFHYVPLHASPAGIKYGRFHGVEKWTTVESMRLLRLPLYYGIREEDILTVAGELSAFYGLA